MCRFGGRRIIPALAGNTEEPAPPSDGDKDHPRSRGEYGCSTLMGNHPRGSSPLSRGIQARPVELPRTLGIIPALAGNTLVGDFIRFMNARIIPALAGNTFPGLPGSGLSGDHPRSRGEYARGLELLHKGGGSSPLSRGIRRLPWAMSFMEGIIPALAGNT